MKNVLRKLEGNVQGLDDVMKEEEQKQQYETNEQDMLQMILGEINNKTLNITGEFDLKLLERVQEFARNLYFYENDPNRTIVVNISSYGGDVNILFSIISILEELKTMWDCTVTTVVKGFAYSCGAVLWLYGDYREITEYDEIMIHQVLYGCMGQLKDHSFELKRSEKIQKKIDKLITSHCPLTQKQLNKWYKNGQDMFLDYDDCEKLGLIKPYEYEENK